MSYKIKELPLSERPRERLKSVGVSNLTDRELLAIILKSGTYKHNVNEVAIDLLKSRRFSELKDISLNELLEIKGIGEVKAIELMATIEIGKRIFVRDVIHKKKLENPEEIWKDSRYLFYNRKQECFYAYYFNNKQEVICKKLIFMGTVNNAVTHTREIFKEAYQVSASTIVCLHNHPSGDVTPSRADISFTARLFRTGEIQGIPVVDHIIVSDNSYYSFYMNKDTLNL